jgi:hypothetical protein
VPCWLLCSALASVLLILTLCVLLFGLVEACFPRLFDFYFALHEGCSCFCIWDFIPFTRVHVPFGAVAWKSVGPGCLGDGQLFGGF